MGSPDSLLPYALATDPKTDHHLRQGLLQGSWIQLPALVARKKNEGRGTAPWGTSCCFCLGTKMFHVEF